MRCFKAICFLFVPLLSWIPSDACFLVRVEHHWHLQRLFWTQPGSLPICCTWETSLEEGEDWQLFDRIWCLRSYTELPSTCLPVQNPQLFLLLLVLPQPSGMCVTGMWFGSSVIVTQEACKDSGLWDLLFDPVLHIWIRLQVPSVHAHTVQNDPCSSTEPHFQTRLLLICRGVVLGKPFIGEMAE